MNRTLNLTALVVFSLAGLIVVSSPAVLSAANWNGGSGTWNSAANWNTPADVPDSPGDTALVSVAGTYAISLTGLSPNIDSFTLNNSNATVNFDNTVATTFTTSGAWANNAGTFFARGPSGTNINVGSWTNSGTFRVGGTSNVHNLVTINSPTALLNSGTIQIQRTNGWQGRINVAGASSITNLASGSIAISSIAPHSGVLQLDSSITNSGAVSIAADSPTTFGLANASYQNVAATSTFTVSSILTVSGANSTFSQTDGITTINSAGQIVGLSSFTLDGGSLVANGLLSTGSFTQNGGTSSGSANVSVGAGGIINLNAGTSLGQFSLGGSPLPGTPAQLNIAGGHTFAAGTTITGYGTITGSFSVAAGKSFNVNAFTGSTNGQTVTTPAFTNQGDINIAGSGAGWHINLSVPTGTLTNAATGVITLSDGTGSGSQRFLSAQLNNLGTINVNTNTTTPQLGRTGAAHVNAGTIEINDAVSIIGSSFTQTGGSFVLTSGAATISTTSISFVGGMIEGGAGSLNNNVNATGVGSGLTLSPGQSTGILDINGNVVLDANDAIAIELGGTTQGALVNGYDYLDVSGGLNLGGADLELSFVNGFAPDSSDVFTILNAGTLTGTFGNSFGSLFVAGDYTFDITYTGQQVILSNATFIPEPSTFVLLGIGTLGIAVSRRRPRALVKKS